MFDAQNKKQSISKYLDISDRMNAPFLIEDDTNIAPVEEPLAFVQPDAVNWSEFDADEELAISISNVGGGFLIISRVFADVDWIHIEDVGTKKALEWSDKPLTLKAKIDRERLPAGEHPGNIIIETKQEAQTIHQIPVRLRIPKEDSALVVPSVDLVDFGSILMHKEVEFTFKSGSAEVVYLQGDFTNWSQDRIPMSKVEGEKFHVTIPLEDGEYLYQFNADGKDFPDPDNQQRILIGEQGICSKLIINRYSRTFELVNVGTKSLKVELIPSGERIKLSEYQFSLGKREKKQVSIFLQPHLMNLGLNSYRIDIRVKSQQSGSVMVRARGMAYGPVAEIFPQELLLGEVFRGADIAGSLKIRNVGKGTFVGNIVVEEPWLRSGKFEVPESAEMEIPIPVDSEQLLPGEYKANISLLTNSYIYGKDRFDIPLEFRLISMEVEPKEIDFGVMWVGEPKEQQFRTRRSDGARMALIIPQDLPSWLEVTSAGRQTLAVKINWNGLHLQSDQDIEAVVDIADGRSPLHESMYVRGRVLIPHITVDELDFGAGRWKKKKLPLIIQNLGNGKLVIYKIEISEEQKWISLKVKRKRNTPPEFMVMVNRRFIPKPDRYNPLTSVIRIYSNDPIEPIIDVFVIIGGAQD